MKIETAQPKLEFLPITVVIETAAEAAALMAALGPSTTDQMKEWWKNRRDQTIHGVGPLNGLGMSVTADEVKEDSLVYLLYHNCNKQLGERIK